MASVLLAGLSLLACPSSKSAAAATPGWACRSTSLDGIALVTVSMMSDAVDEGSSLLWLWLCPVVEFVLHSRYESHEQQACKLFFRTKANIWTCSCQAATTRARSTYLLVIPSSVKKEKRRQSVLQQIPRTGVVVATRRVHITFGSAVTMSQLTCRTHDALPSRSAAA